MALNSAQEDRIAAARAAKRQSRETPLLINQDDGRLFPNVPLVARNPKYRPYHGDPNASLQERMRYLKGLAPQRRQVINTRAEALEPFDIGTADKDALIAFAMDEYGAALNPAKTLKQLRQEVSALAKLDEEAGGLPGAPEDDNGDQ